MPGFIPIHLYIFIYFQKIYHPLENDAKHNLVLFQNTSSSNNAKEVENVFRKRAK